MAWALPRLLRRLGAALVHTQYAVPLRCPCPAVVTIHDLSFEREPGLMSRKDRLVFRRVVPRAARSRAPRADGLRALEARPRRALWPAPGEGRRDAERRRSRLLARSARRSTAATSSRSARSSPARTSLRRSPPPTSSGCRSSSPGRRRTTATARELREGAPSCAGYVSTRRARDALPRRRLPRAGVALRGLRASGARGDGERDAGCDRARGGAARGRRRRRRRRGARTTLADGVRRALAERTRLVAAPASSGRGASRGAPRPRRRSRSTWRRSVGEGLGRRRLARSRGRARALAARARCRRSTSSSSSRTYPARVGRAPGRRAGDREPAPAAARGERQPRRRGDERRARPLLQPRRGPRGGRGRDPRSRSWTTRPRCGIAGPQMRWPDGTWQPSRRRFPTVRGHDRAADAAAQALPTRTSASATTTCSTSGPTEPVQADWLLGGLPAPAPRDARGARRLGRGLPALRRGHRPLLPRDARRAGSAGTCPAAVVTPRLRRGDRPALPLAAHALALRGMARFVRKHPERLRGRCELEVRSVRRAAEDWSEASTPTCRYLEHRAD